MWGASQALAGGMGAGFASAALAAGHALVTTGRGTKRRGFSNAT
jgi:hypothetical protein